MPDECDTRTGIDRTAASMRASAAKHGQQITHEEARARVVRAMKTTEQQEGR